MNDNSPSRRIELDVMRILAILAVFIFHTNMIFNTDTWHIKNATPIPGADEISSVMALWLMPIIFIISGASIVFAMRRRSTGRFVVDRVKRLLVPLVFGIFTIGPYMVYMELYSHGLFQGSFWDFLPHYFDGMYGFGGNFAWMGLHLWYLEVLFVFTLLLLPVFLLLKTGRGTAFIGWLAHVAEKPLVILLFGLPLLLSLTLDPETWGRDNFGGKDLLTYLFCLLMGFILFSDDRFVKSIIRQRWIFLGAALLLLFGRIPLFAFSDTVYLSPAYYFERGYNQVETWVWMMMLLGMGMQYLKYDNRVTRYANEAVLPFYWLHQPVIITVGYFVTISAFPALAKFWVVLLVAFGITVGIYEFLVRRWNVPRVLLGMKPLVKEKAAHGSLELSGKHTA